MLVRLLYASRTDQPITPTLIESILKQSREHNPHDGITGTLCFGGNIFMQVLEGGRDAVNNLYNKIVRDGRHTHIVVLHYEEVSERRFAGWTMGSVNLDRINPSILLKYSEQARLDPFSVSGKVSLALLDELMLTASVVGRADQPRTTVQNAA
jgi:hypothetical protein